MTWPTAADPMGEAPDTKRLKILISAYACEPGEGSEPGVGWNVAVEAARRHEGWGITRANNRRGVNQTSWRPAPSTAARTGEHTAEIHSPLQILLPPLLLKKKKKQR